MKWNTLGLWGAMLLSLFSADRLLAQTVPQAPLSTGQPPGVVPQSLPGTIPNPFDIQPQQPPTASSMPAGSPVDTLTSQSALPTSTEVLTGDPVSYGPTPLGKVGIINGMLGERAKSNRFTINSWIESDYTYRTSGSGPTTVAPQMNRYGNEFLFREMGVVLSRALDPKDLSWGFNIIYFGGSDAAYIKPTKGWISNPDPRFSHMFTDLNVTAHLPLLTDGGVDIKAGRQTSVLGPMGALGWQRTFGSADYGWYNLEEGRFTGVSANWHINKRLSWYNGLELGWGTFFAQIGNDVDYLTQLVYWLDPDAKRTKTWLTLLTGPTSVDSNKNTTVVEAGIQHDWSKRLWQMVNFQMVYARGPVNAPVPPGYLQRAYTVYTYMGYHITEKLDFNSRYDWYKDVDGRGYAGGYGVPNTDYFEVTYGFNFHPHRWIEYRPEIRYDYASNPNFGNDHNKSNQLTLAINILMKF